MKYNRHKFIDINYFRPQLTCRRTLSIAGNHNSENENSFKNYIHKSDKNKKFMKIKEIIKMNSM